MSDEGLGGGAADATVAAGDQDGARRMNPSLDASDYCGVDEKPAKSLVLEAETDLQPDLEGLDFAVLGLPTDLGDFKPVDVSQRLARAFDPVTDGLINGIG